MKRLFLAICAMVPAVCAFMAPSQAQITASTWLPHAIPQQDRVLATNSAQKAILQGQVPHWAGQSANAQSVDTTQTREFLVLLKRSASVQTAFDRFTHDQQIPGSSVYHRWLTPQQIGTIYGPTTHDVQAVTNWLQGQGLQVKDTDPARMVIVASGRLEDIASAFHTSFASYQLRGQKLLGIRENPSVPASLAPVVQSVSGLNDLPNTTVPEFIDAKGERLLAPNDFATIYDISPVYAAGNTGATTDSDAQHIAIVGLVAPDPADVSAYMKLVGISKYHLNTYQVGDQAPFDAHNQGEATLDVERTLSQASGAQTDLLLSDSPEGAMYYSFGHLQDPVLSFSYGNCVDDVTDAFYTEYNFLTQVGAAEGVTILVSAGDSGAACGGAGPFHTPNGDELLGVNPFCSSPYVTCVGGTEFNEGDNDAEYWSSTGSALGYIPEGAWNEPQASNGSFVLVGTGGGPTPITAKPDWQTGEGVPNDLLRDVPDVSFTASGHAPYLVVMNGIAEGVRGTSAAAPSMAAIAALLNTHMGTSQGNLNPFIYRLAQSAAYNEIFHDVTLASSGHTSCDVTVPSTCNNTMPSATSLTGGITGYAIGTGYDLATGWGSIDVARFLAAATPVTTSISVSPSTGELDEGQTVTLTATLTGTSVVPASGTVQFYGNGSALGSPVSLTNGTTATLATAFSTPGAIAITASYSGDTFFQPAQSATGSLQVATPSLSLQAASPALSIARGASGTNSITLTSNHGFTGSVQISCSLQDSTGKTITGGCTAATQTLMLSADGNASTTVTIRPSTTLALLDGNTSSGIRASVFYSFGFGLLFAAGFRRRVSKLRAFAVSSCFAVLILLGGCGGGHAKSNSTIAYQAVVTATPAQGANATQVQTTTFAVAAN